MGTNSFPSGWDEERVQRLIAQFESLMEEEQIDGDESEFTLTDATSRKINAASDDPNEIIGRLVDAWCERRDYCALARVLPAWQGNNRLTDGWENLHDALKHAYAMCTHLPSNERESIKKAYVDIDVALRNR